VRIVQNGRGSRFFRCTKSGIEEGYLKYPPQPIFKCGGYQLINAQMKGNKPEIKNLLIDLGGVLYAIDYSLIESGMQRIQSLSRTTSVKYSKSFQDELFSQFERGEISAEVFYAEMKVKFELEASQEEFEQVWNSMLFGLIPGRLELIQSLKTRYRLFLLSNTNIVHYNYLIPECQEIFGLFDQCYFSFEMGKRKPSVEIFQQVLEEQGLLPEETLFIEDSPQHIITANGLGIHTLFASDSNWPEQLTFHLS